MEKEIIDELGDVTPEMFNKLLERNLDYEKEVKRVRLDAAKQLHGVICYIQNGRDGDALGSSFNSFEDAWKSAYHALKEKGEI